MENHIDFTADEMLFLITEVNAPYFGINVDNGVLGSFEASRFATGRKNFNCFEIYGSKGSIIFNLERMNELQFYSTEDPPGAQGLRNILVTESEHPYLKAWWPPGQIIGYQHSFVNAMADFLHAIGAGSSITPNFADGVKEMQVLGAALQSARTGRAVDVAGYAGG